MLLFLAIVFGVNTYKNYDFSKETAETKKPDLKAKKETKKPDVKVQKETINKSYSWNLRKNEWMDFLKKINS